METSGERKGKYSHELREGKGMRKKASQIKIQRRN